MNQEIDEINRRIILLKNNVEEKEYEIRRLNSKIANLSTDMDIFEKIHMNNMDFYGSSGVIVGEKHPQPQCLC